MIQKDEGLKRTIGVFGLSANIINIIVGAGIFALPAIVAMHMGAASIIAYLVCGLIVTLVMLCFAEAGSRMPSTGGAYVYIETAFGDYAGFLGGLFSLASAILADAAVSNALINVLATLNPFFEIETVRFAFLFVVFLGLGYINVIGIKQGIGLVKITVVAKLIPLLLLVIFGWKDVAFGNLAFDSGPGFEELGKTALILFFAFQGCESGIIVGGEVVNPKRNIPRAILISIAIIVVLYLLIQIVSQGVLGSELPNFKAAPLAEVARIIFGPVGFIILIIGTAVSMFGFLSGDILNNPRILYALARDKVIPFKGFAKIHKSFKTPYIAIIVYAIIAFVLAVTGNFVNLVVLSSGAIIIIYIGVVLAVIKMRYSQKRKPGEFKIPGGLTVPIFAIGAMLYFLSYLTWSEIVGIFIFIGIASLLFFVNKKIIGRNDEPGN